MVNLRGKKAVILDRHPLWLEAVDQVLRKTGLELVGKTSDPDEVHDLVVQKEPDLLVIETDSTDPDFDGVGVLRKARARQPELKAIVVSMQDSPQDIETAFAAGATAYVVKTAQPEDLSTAVRQVFGTSVFFAGPRRVGSIESRPPLLEVDERDPGLTRREIEILRLVAEGYSNAQVARALWVTEQTVKFHLSNIYRKLDVSNRTEASRWAQTRNLLPPTQQRLESSAA